MTDQQGFLQSAYRAVSPDETREFYQDWARTYDDEVRENGYITPSRCAAALAELVPDKAAPVLDIGCGTGLSGLALRDAGFRVMDGSDLSPEMLKGAAAHKELYRKLWEVDLKNPFPFAPATYQNAAAMGVLATSHAPAGTIDEILAILPAGGMFVFSLNDHTLKDPEYEARINENVDAGRAAVRFREHGPHLPGIGMQSRVYVLQKR